MGVQAIPGCQFRERQVAPDRLQFHLRLEIGASALSRRVHSRANPLDQDWLSILSNKPTPPPSRTLAQRDRWI